MMLQNTAKTWQKISDVSYFLGSSSFDFINANDGCYGDVGYFNNFTTNAGVNWIDYEVSKYLFVKDYQLVGKDIFGDYRIFAAGNDGRILKYTFNNYLPDTYPDTYTSADLNSISLHMKDRTPHLWAGGEGFTILHTVTEIVSDVDEKPNMLVKDFVLSDNFPNPFNSQTTISYSIPNTSLVQIQIFDILGREVSTLLNEEKASGNYQINFDASELTSGVYFYRIKARNFVETKKMILMK